MLPTPKKYTLVAASAEGPTELNAFDHALLAAGIGNLNLLKVSSILPPGAELVERLAIPSGSLTPTAYGAIQSETPGEYICRHRGWSLTRLVRCNHGVFREVSRRGGTLTRNGDGAGGAGQAGSARQPDPRQIDRMPGGEMRLCLCRRRVVVLGGKSA